MKTTKEIRQEIVGIINQSPEGEPFIIDSILESYAQQIRKEEQDKTREVAIEFAGFYYDAVTGMPVPLGLIPSKVFDEFTKKQGGQG